MANLNQLYSNALGAFSQAGRASRGMQGVAGRINQNPNIQGGMNPVGWTGTGIATIPQSGGGTLGSRSSGHAQSAPAPMPMLGPMPGSDASITMARREQANDMGVLLGTDVGLSEAAGRDISGWGQSIYSPYNDPTMSDADWIKAMTSLEAKAMAGTATAEELQLLNTTSSVYRKPSLAEGGIVSLNYLTRGL